MLQAKSHLQDQRPRQKSKPTYRHSSSTHSCFARHVHWIQFFRVYTASLCNEFYDYCDFTQVFNELNARSLTDEWNVFTRLAGSSLFFSVIVVEVGLQVGIRRSTTVLLRAKSLFFSCDAIPVTFFQAVLVELGGAFAGTCGLTALHWVFSILLAGLTVPLGFIMRVIPVPEKPSDFAHHFEERFAVSVCVCVCACRVHTCVSACACVRVLLHSIF
jgi:hypothetical protein